MKGKVSTFKVVLSLALAALILFNMPYSNIEVDANQNTQTEQSSLNQNTLGNNSQYYTMVASSSDIGMESLLVASITTGPATDIELSQTVDVTTGAVIEVASAEDLMDINNNLDGDYILVSNIDLEGQNFTPIASKQNPFTGNLDGNGYSIKNLFIDNGKNNQGLFASIAGGKISNLNIINADVIGKSTVGIIAGSMTDGSIENLSITGNVTVYAENSSAGGFVGEGSNLNISESSLNGDIYSNNYAGGFAGQYDNGNVGNSIYQGTVESKNDRAGGISGQGNNITATKITSISNVKGNNDVGGLFGELHGGIITDCTWQGEINAKNQRAGGLAGLLENVNVEKSISYGSIAGNNFLGLIAGDVNQGTITDSYSVGEVYGGNNFIGGFIGNIKEANISNVYTLSDVSGLNQKGGLIGKAVDSSISNAYAIGTIGSDKHVGGLIGNTVDSNVTNSYFNADTYNIIEPIEQSKSTEELTQKATYIDWDFNNLWKMAEGYSTPVLKDLPVPLHDDIAYYDVNAYVTTHSISLEFNKLFMAKQYDVEFNGEIIDTISGTSYTFSGLEPGTVYTIRLRGKNESTIGMVSAPIQIITLPVVPQNVTISTENFYENTISFDSVKGAASYDVEILNTPVDTSGSTTYIHKNLAPNTQYTYRVRAKNESGAGDWSELMVQKTLPDVPKGVKTEETDNKVDLSWDHVPGALFYEVVIDGSEVIEKNDTQYIHKELVHGTKHTYKIRAKNSEGFGPYCDEIETYTLLEQLKNIEITSNIDSIEINFDGVDKSEYYEIQVNGQTINIGQETHYKHEGLEPNTENIYKIRAVASNTQSIWTTEYKATTLSEAPHNITDEPEENEIKCSWDKILLANSYEIEINGQIYTVTNTEFVSEGLTPCTTYTYRVRAVTEAGKGEWSDYFKATTKLGIPQNIKTTFTENEIQVTWDEVDGATSYELIIDGNVVDNGSSTSYIHNNLEPNSVHIFRIRAKKDIIVSEFSDAYEVTTLLGIPGNLRTTSNSNSILVQWDAVDGAIAYDLELNGQIIELNNVTEYNDENLMSNTTYQYRVRAKNSNGIGAFSNYVRRTTAPAIPIAPNTPEFYKIVKEADGFNSYKVIIDWEAVEGATAYDIEVDGVVIEDITNTAYEHTSLQPNTKHEYRLRAKNIGGTSAWSELVSINTPVDLSANISKDEYFNFVTVIPCKEGENTRTVEVTYNPEELNVIDLCALTSELNISEGAVNGTNIRVDSFKPGDILFTVSNANKTVMNIIKFQVIKEGFSNVVYDIK